MIFGSTKSKLDHIIETGFKRMDEAVEGVIAKCPRYELDRLSTTDRSAIRFSAREDLRITDDQAQRLYNYRMSSRVERSALARQGDWDGYRKCMMRDMGIEEK